MLVVLNKEWRKKISSMPELGTGNCRVNVRFKNDIVLRGDIPSSRGCVALQLTLQELNSIICSAISEITVRD